MPADLPSRGLTPLDVDVIPTPRDIERRLSELYNDAIRAEVVRRERSKLYRETAKAYRKAKLSAATHAQCPVVSSTPRVTVAQRQAWIDARIDEETEDLKTAEALLEDAMDYVRFLENQTGKVQTLSKFVLAAYNNAMAGSAGPR